jgi:hypothetical protein
VNSGDRYCWWFDLAKRQGWDDIAAHRYALRMVGRSL